MPLQVDTLVGDEHDPSIDADTTCLHFRAHTLVTVSSQPTWENIIQPLQGFNTHHTITSPPTLHERGSKLISPMSYRHPNGKTEPDSVAHAHAPGDRETTIDMRADHKDALPSTETATVPLCIQGTCYMMSPDDM